MTDPALSGYSPPADPPATIGKLAEALRVLLLPDPLLSFLPTALEYLSTFQRLAEAIYHGAQAAADADIRIRSQLEQSKVPENEWAQHGGLSDEEVGMLDDIGDGLQGLEEHYSNVMIELSIKLRLYHTAAMLASAVTLPQTRGITSQYFPDEIPQAIDGTVPHRYMKSQRYDDYKAMLKTSRDFVEQWYERAEAALEAGRKRPTVDSLMRSVEPGYSHAYPPKLAQRVIEIVELVLKHVKDLQEICPDKPEPEAGAEDGQAIDEFAMEDVLRDDGPDYQDMDDTPALPAGYSHNSAEPTPVRRRIPDEPARSNKRPRPSSYQAPDYTSSAGKMGSRVDKSILRPFDESRLRRASNPIASPAGATQRKPPPTSGTQDKPIEM